MPKQFIVFMKKTTVLFPLFMAASYILQLFFSILSWQFFVCVILMGIMMGGMQKKETLSTSLFLAFFHSVVFTIASFSTSVIVLVLIAKGTFEKHDVLTLSLPYLVAFFIGSLIGITIWELRDMCKASKNNRLS